MKKVMKVKIFLLRNFFDDEWVTFPDYRFRTWHVTEEAAKNVIAIEEKRINYVPRVIYL